MAEATTLGLAASIVASSALSALFVLSLYIWPLLGLHPPGADRDHPRVIRQRFASAVLTCAVSALVLAAMLPQGNGGVAVSGAVAFDASAATLGASAATLGASAATLGASAATPGAETLGASAETLGASAAVGSGSSGAGGSDDAAVPTINLASSPEVGVADFIASLVDGATPQGPRARYLARVAREMGIQWRGSLVAGAMAAVLVLLFFAAPLAAWLAELYDSVEPRASPSAAKPDRSDPHHAGEDWFWVLWWFPVDIQHLRNVYVAPVAEEFVFRGCVVPLLTEVGGVAPRHAVWLAPLLFSVAHAHHVVHLRRQRGLRTAVAMVAFQFAYTYVFGVFSASLFVRTRRLAAPTVAHMICNAFGFPELGELWAEPDTARRWVYRGLLLAGPAAFAVLYTTLTDASLF
jgi:membrane protease YdiL (CAAX protease family)